MTIQLIDTKLIDPNPYQPPSRLNIAPEKFSDLASIGDPAIGLRVIPTVRPHPTKPGRFQRCDGHRRQAAWEYYRPGEPMPNDVQDLTDRQMYDYMAIENGQRQDLTPIEKAIIIKGHIDNFGSTQLAAGALVGIRTQGAVSNLLGLLDLPEPIQTLVANGTLPERFARRLRTLRTLNADKDLIDIAQKTAQYVEVEDDHTNTKEQIFLGAVYKLVCSKCEYMQHAPWVETWKPDQPADIGDGRIMLPACKGCADNRLISHSRYCLRPSCWKAKLAQHANVITIQCAQKHHIPLVTPGEKVVIIEDSDQARAVLASKHGAVRLAPKVQQSSDWWTRDKFKSVTGSEYARVAVLASKADEVLKAVKAKAAAKSTGKKNTTIDYSKKQREQESKRKAYHAAIDATLESLTPVIASRLPSDANTLMMMTAFCALTYNSASDKDSAQIQRQWMDNRVIKAKPADLKTYIAREIISVIIEDANYQDLSDARKELADFATAVKITLPPHWDAALTPPAAGEGKQSKAKAKK